MRRLLLCVALAIGCSPRAGRALLPQVDVRASAHRARTATSAQWRHDVRVVATFRTDAQLQRPPIPEPADHAPVAPIQGRLPCRVRALCDWERQEAHRALAAFGGGP